MITKKPKETIPNGVAEGTGHFVNKTIAGAVFASPLLAFFFIIGNIEKAGANDNDAPVTDKNRSFCAKMLKSRDSTPSYQADFETIKGNAILGITADCTALWVRLNLPQTGFQKAVLKCPSCSIEPVSLVPGLNVITKDVKALWNGLAAEKVYIFLKTTDREGEEVVFLPMPYSSH